MGPVECHRRGDGLLSPYPAGHNRHPSGAGRIDAATGRCRRTVSRFDGRSDYLSWSFGFNSWKPKRNADGTPRLSFAMAERRELPGFIGAIHPRFHTPHIAIYLSELIVLGLTLTGTFIYAATISVIARLLVYAATCAALSVLHRRENSPAAEFVVLHGVVVSIVSLPLVAWLLTNITALQARDAGIAAAIGLLIYFASRGKGRRRRN